MADESQTKISLSPVFTTVLVAFVGLIGTGVGALTQGWFNRQLERDKFEFSKDIEREKNKANLVLKVIETGDPEKAKTNLLFLVKAGLIDDRDGKILALANNTATVPVLPKAAGSSSSQPAATPVNSRSSTLQFYDVADKDVYLEISVGFAMFAKYDVFLFDATGHNPQKIYTGTNGAESPPTIKIGPGPELVGKVVSIQIVVSAVQDAPNMPVNLRFILKGGKADKTFTLGGALSGSTALYTYSIRFRQ